MDRVERARKITAGFRELWPYEPRFLETEHGSLHYVDEGPRDRPAILCLHGNPTWGFYWRRAIEELSPNYRVIVPDHLGCGLSDKPNWRSDLDGHIAGVQALVEALELEKLTLFVHDWGGIIGASWAVQNPERVARIAFTNTAAFPSKRIPLRIALCRTPVLGQLALQGLGLFGKLAITQAVETPLREEVKRGLLAPYDTWSNRRAQWRFVMDIPMSPGHPSWPTLEATGVGLPRLAHKPIALLWGEKDWCFSPQFREEFEQRFPNAEVHRFPAAGHYLMEDAGGEVCEVFEGWLARHPLPSGLGSAEAPA